MVHLCTSTSWVDISSSYGCKNRHGFEPTLAAKSLIWEKLGVEVLPCIDVCGWSIQLSPSMATVATVATSGITGSVNPSELLPSISLKLPFSPSKAL